MFDVLLVGILEASLIPPILWVTGNSGVEPIIPISRQFEIALGRVRVCARVCIREKRGGTTHILVELSQYGGWR